MVNGHFCLYSSGKDPVQIYPVEIHDLVQLKIQFTKPSGQNQSNINNNSIRTSQIIVLEWRRCRVVDESD
jgi:hypothetical protein